MGFGGTAVGGGTIAAGVGGAAVGGAAIGYGMHRYAEANPDSWLRSIGDAITGPLMKVLYDPEIVQGRKDLPPLSQAQLDQIANAVQRGSESARPQRGPLTNPSRVSPLDGGR